MGKDMEKMKKHYAEMALAGVLMLSLVCCGKTPAPAPANTPSPEPVNTPVPEPTPSPIRGESSEEKQERLEEFQFVLQQLAFEHIWPDGRDAGFDGEMGFIEENRFAIFDVDEDGRDELMVEFTTAPMAGMMEAVYSYDAQTGTVRAELEEFPMVTYLTGGLAMAGWSHASGLEGEGYWPYTLYGYDAASDRYVQLAEVAMWSKSVDTVNYKGDPYPDEIDAEQAGTVFILTRNGETETVSKSEYEAWLASVTGAGVEMEIPWQDLNEVNIKAVAGQ